jgi:hypothetical protein
MTNSGQNIIGVKLSDWSVPGVSVNAHVGLAGYRGVWFFMRRERLAVSAPEGWLAHINQYVTNVTSYEKAAEEAALRELFREDFDRTIGPAFQGALTPKSFLRVRSTNVRRLYNAFGNASTCITCQPSIGSTDAARIDNRDCA